MNHKALIKHWNFILAFKEGKKLQWKGVTDDVWFDVDSPPFRQCDEYRIKPEPIIRWLNVYATAGIHHKTKEEADDNSTPGRIACVPFTYIEGEGL